MTATTVRTAARAAVVVGGSLLLLAATSPAALAVNRDDGDEPGPGMSMLDTVLVFVGLPILLYVLIAALVYARSLARGPRYRPGLSWWAAPVWFNGPDDAEAAVAGVDTPRAGGGASARW